MRLAVFVEWFVHRLLNRLKLRPNMLRLNSVRLTNTAIDVHVDGSVLLNKMIETFVDDMECGIICVIKFLCSRLLSACVQDF